MMLQLFGLLGQERRRGQQSHVSEGMQLGSIGHAFDPNERQGRRRDKMTRVVKSIFGASRIVSHRLVLLPRMSEEIKILTISFKI